MYVPPMLSQFIAMGNGKRQAYNLLNMLTYRKTSNKRAWAFAGIVGLKRTFSPSNSFSAEIIQKRGKTPQHEHGVSGVGRGVYWGFYGMPGIKKKLSSLIFGELLNC